MFSFFSRPALGIEISAKAVRAGVIANGRIVPAHGTARNEPLAPGTILEGYGALNIRDPDRLSSALSACISAMPRLRSRRTGLSLADSIFRIQSLDLDDFPPGMRDREKLVRWKLEKATLFDSEGTVLRYQAVPRPGGGFSVMACAVKRDVIAQYEDLLESLGREVWYIGPSSISALNFYASALGGPGTSGYAFCWVTDTWYALIVMEGGGPRFYRLREIKPGAAGESPGRIVREIEDTLHFYAHRDRMGTAAIGRLALAGEAPFLPALAAELRNIMTMEVDLLTASAAGAEAMAPAFGAGGIP